MKKYYNSIKNNMDIILGIIFISYFICLIFLSHLYFKYLFFVVGIGFIVYHFIKNNLKSRKNVYRILKGIFMLFMCIFLVTESAMIFYPKKNIKDCDYIIVLGALVNKNIPSKTLKDRLDASIDYINKSKDDVYIVVSGGKGRGEDISEAEAMNKYLVDKGIDSYKILKEDKSTTTQENFKYSKEVIEKHSKKNIEELNIKIITTDFHSLRSSIMARKYGVTNISFYTSRSKYYLMPLNYLREFFATMYYIFIH